MSKETKAAPKGSDWTRLLTDPDLVTHLGKLLQTYRDVPPEQREAALLRAMREIKETAIKGRESNGIPEPVQAKAKAKAKVEAKVEARDKAAVETKGEQKIPEPQEVKETQAAEPQTAKSSEPEPQNETQKKEEAVVVAAIEAAPVEAAPAPAPVSTTILHAPEPTKVAPPFEPDPLQADDAESDRRRSYRLKCYVAVEIHVEGLEKPVWGNLANVSRGGCLVETASAVPPGKILEIGLWVASGKIWVKGVIISGIATRSASSFGLRVKFSQSELSEKEHLREFLKFVEGSARKSQSGNAYLAQLKT